MEASERRFRAMGSGAHVVVVGDTDLSGAAAARIADLEQRWSRFLANSEISLLNGMPGTPVIVSPETFELIAKAVFGWRTTQGRFDPTVLEALVAAGYDRSFGEMQDASPRATRLRQGAPGCAGIELDTERLAVTLPRGVSLDPGGIGKGLAADIVVRELLAAGAEGAMVNLGGDVRVAGLPPEGDVWMVSVESPFDPDDEIVRLRLTDGAVVTSSRMLRRWRHDGHEVHHLLDPETGRPLDTGVAAITVVAGEGWWAEVMAKAAFAAGVDRAPSVLVNAAALLVDMSGGRHATPGFEEVAA